MPAAMTTSPALGRLVRRALLWRFVLFAGAASMLLAGGTVVQALALGGVQADKALLGLLWALLAMAPVAVPVAMTTAVFDHVATLHRDGGGRSLQALGLRASTWWRAWLGPAVACVALGAVAEHAAGPMGRRGFEAIVRSARVDLAPVDGTTRRVGPVAVAGRPEGGAYLAALGMTGTARAIEAAADSVRADGVALSGGGRRFAAEHVLWRARRPEGLSIGARWTLTLLRSPDVYARWNGVRRGVLPLASAGMLVAAGELAARWPRVPSALAGVACAAAMWMVVRALDVAVRDHVAPVPVAALALVLVPCLVAIGVRFRTMRPSS